VYIYQRFYSNDPGLCDGEISISFQDENKFEKIFWVYVTNIPI